MKRLLPAIILLMMTTAFAQQPMGSRSTSVVGETGPMPAITDPAKLESKTVADMQNFSIEKL